MVWVNHPFPGDAGTATLVFSVHCNNKGELFVCPPASPSRRHHGASRSAPPHSLHTTRRRSAPRHATPLRASQAAHAPCGGEAGARPSGVRRSGPGPPSSSRSVVGGEACAVPGPPGARSAEQWRRGERRRRRRRRRAPGNSGSWKVSVDGRAAERGPGWRCAPAGRAAGMLGRSRAGGCGISASAGQPDLAARGWLRSAPSRARLRAQRPALLPRVPPSCPRVLKRRRVGCSP